MGFGGISTTQLLILLGVCLVVFGSRRIRGLGEDLGEALKGLRKGVGELEE